MTEEEADRAVWDALPVEERAEYHAIFAECERQEAAEALAEKLAAATTEERVDIWAEERKRQWVQANELIEKLAAATDEERVDILAKEPAEPWIKDLAEKYSKPSSGARQLGLDFRTASLNNLRPGEFAAMRAKTIRKRDAHLALVRRQRNWDRWLPDIREALAHLVGHIRRRVFDVASAGVQ